MEKKEETLMKQEEIAQRLLKEVYKQLPQVEGKVNCYELSSPLQHNTL
jgi:all-trans-retinol 13,14-reductase